MKKTKRTSRRDFVHFFGKVAVASILVPPFLESCGNHNNRINGGTLTEEDREQLNDLLLEGISPTSRDDVVLSRGLNSRVLIRWGTPINETEKFGINNDFTCFIPMEEGVDDDGLLWVNHENISPFFISGLQRDEIRPRRKQDVDEERKHVGGSIIRVKKIDGQWTFIPDDPLNRRIDATTEIPFNWPHPIDGSDKAIGTHSNCSGGITPWGTILTCEENYEDFYGYSPKDKVRPYGDGPSYYGWDDIYPLSPDHYGWVVEVDPLTGRAQKHVALGRFAHENATMKKLDDGRLVVYMGDDKENEFIYKFISSKPNSLTEGILYVADTENGRWMPLDYESQPALQREFPDQTEVLLRARRAARIMGATPQNRPEEIEIDPITGHVFVALTKNPSVGDYHGEIMKIKEDGNRYDALTFETETLATGGKESGFACPDNLTFDLSGNLWFTCDISSGSMNKLRYPQYWSFKNNGLFVLIRHGEEAGKIIQVASAPIEAEFTGPWFSPDHKTLFLSVQHPGSKTTNLNRPTSTWPHDGDGLPKSSVITIEGPLIDKLNHLAEMNG